MLNLTLDDYILALFSLVTIILIINSLNAYTEIRNLRLINEELRTVIEARIEINRLQTEIQETSSTIINANQRSQTLENNNRYQSGRINDLKNDIQTLINRNVRLNEILRCRPQPICQTEEVNNLRNDNNRLREAREESIRKTAQQAEKINSLEEQKKTLECDKNNLERQIRDSRARH